MSKQSLMVVVVGLTALTALMVGLLAAGLPVVPTLPSWIQGKAQELGFAISGILFLGSNIIGIIFHRMADADLGTRVAASAAVRDTAVKETQSADAWRTIWVSLMQFAAGGIATASVMYPLLGP